MSRSLIRHSRAGIRLPTFSEMVERPFLFPVGIYVALSTIQEALGQSTIHRNFLFLSILVMGYRTADSRRLFSLSAASALFFLFGILAIMSVAWNTFGTGGSGTVALFAMVLLCYLLANYEYRSVDLSDLRLSMCLGSFLPSLYQVGCYMAGEAYFINERLTPMFFSRPEDPNTFAAYLSLGLAATLQGFFLSTKNWFKAGFYVFAMGIIMTTILLTGSRGGSIGVGILFSVFLFASRKPWHWKVAFVVAAAFALRGLPGFEMILERWNDSYVATGTGRTVIWQILLARFQEKWLFGHGLGSFSNLYYEFGNSDMKVAHNSYLTALVEQGIVGFSLLFSAVLLVLFGSARNLRNKNVLWLYAGAISFAVQSTFLSLLYMKSFWLVWGLFAGATQFKETLRRRTTSLYRGEDSVASQTG